MAGQGRALVNRHRLDQSKVGAATTALLLELGERYQRGIITRDQFMSSFVAAEKLGHAESVRTAQLFLRNFRAAQIPNESPGVTVADEFDSGASLGRVVGTLKDISSLRRTQSDYDEQFWDLMASLSGRGFRFALDGGRQTIEKSAIANGRRWRRVTGLNPCAFCAMLATRDDYRTEESASRVVGRARGYGTANYRATGQVSYGGVMSRGPRAGQDRRRGTRAPGEDYHDDCNCTVVEVIGDLPPTEAELKHADAYHEARERITERGGQMTTSNILSEMRASGDFRDHHHL